MKKRKQPSPVPWDPAAWLADQKVMLLSTAGRAIWFDVLNRMWMQSANRGIISGTPDQLTRLARCSGSELESFLSAAQQHGLCEVSRDSNGIVTLKHPGLLREDRVRKQTALRVARHRQKTAKSSVTVPVTEIGPRHQSSEQIEEKAASEPSINGAEASPEQPQPPSLPAFDLSHMLAILQKKLHETLGNPG